jgi:glycosyltransferase involved in cell wall biosynthesis
VAEVSIVIPAFDEAGCVGQAVRRVREAFEPTGHVHEVIVVNDGSRDETAREAADAGARVVHHPENVGYGHAVLSGVRHARYGLIAIIDADETYPASALPAMVEEVDRRGLDMLVGARRGAPYSGGPGKRIARRLFKFLAEFTVGQRIPDINSGLRVMRRDMVERFAPVACGGFSFSTTMTLVAMLTGHFVAHCPVEYQARSGASKVRLVRDTLRAGQVLVMAILLFNPIKIFILLAGGVLAAGVIVAIVAAIVPGATRLLGFMSAFFLSACLLMGLGFLAEQRRATSRGQMMMSRDLRVDER